MLEEFLQDLLWFQLVLDVEVNGDLVGVEIENDILF